MLCKWVYVCVVVLRSSSDVFGVFCFALSQDYKTTMGAAPYTHLHTD